jgi:hypothetical protein
VLLVGCTFAPSTRSTATDDAGALPDSHDGGADARGAPTRRRSTMA